MAVDVLGDLDGGLSRLISADHLPYFRLCLHGGTFGRVCSCWCRRVACNAGRSLSWFSGLDVLLVLLLKLSHASSDLCGYVGSSQAIPRVCCSPPLLLVRICSCRPFSKQGCDVHGSGGQVNGPWKRCWGYTKNVIPCLLSIILACSNGSFISTRIGPGHFGWLIQYTPSLVTSLAFSHGPLVMSSSWLIRRVC